MHESHRKISNKSCPNSQNLIVSCLVLQLSFAQSTEANF